MGSCGQVGRSLRAERVRQHLAQRQDARAGCRAGSPARRTRRAPAGTARTASAARPCPTGTPPRRSRPPPVSRSCPTIVHSAHTPSPYEAFSTLQPVHDAPVVAERGGADVAGASRARTPSPRRRTAAVRSAGPVEISHPRPSGTRRPTAAGGRSRCDADGEHQQRDDLRRVGGELAAAPSRSSSRRA